MRNLPNLNKSVLKFKTANLIFCSMAVKWNSCVILLLLTVNTVILHLVHAKEHAVPALYIFGDSTVDVGTNNHFNDTNVAAKADFPFNGIDFPGSRSTGRFSNGYNLADSLSQLMGFQRSPCPFLDLMDKSRVRLPHNMIKGVNFASAGSGILNDTDRWMGTIISLGEQIQQFTIVRQEIEKLLGYERTNSFLAKTIFFISVGSNDIFEYYLHNGIFNMTEFITNLTSTYENHLKMLYSLGAKKFGIVSVPPIGCCPFFRVRNTTGGCLDDLNVYSQNFYSSVEAMLQNLSSNEFKDANYSLGNTYEMVTVTMDNPLSYGFKELQYACCGNGTYNGVEECSPAAKLCSNRTEYMFWDRFHPSQAAARLAALTLYGGTTRFVTPINFQQLKL